MNNKTFLDFEKPLVELENKINKMEDKNSIESLRKEYQKLQKQIFSSLTPYQKVQISRHPKRPTTLDYVNLIFSDFIEIHGDRNFSDDQAVVTGFAIFERIPVVIIGQQKGKTTKENISRNFGMMHPEGYRKALRVMKLAERFNKPIISFIDTPGAFPGIGAEERGQAEAIARNLLEMSMIRTPIICLVIGEGGSGGALGIGIGDRILMLEYAYYSVISPEGCAAILFRDSSKSSKAAEMLKLTADELLKFKLIDDIIKEPIGGAHRDPLMMAKNVKKCLIKHLRQIIDLPVEKLLKNRYKKYRKIGVLLE